MTRHDDDLPRDPAPRETPRHRDAYDEAPRELAEPSRRDPLERERESARERAPMAPASGRGLLVEEDRDRLRERWESVQASFIDEPRGAVAEADTLVSDTIERMMEGFQQQRRQLEQQWDGGADASTEDLRQALKRYRSFFDSLLEL